ncbi:MAG: glycosyltransferase family 4 protein [Deltaproteobacteria bacterium]|nr:glycosyltransferase family 4 protein [Deltaproteobacteria bacterium]
MRVLLVARVFWPNIGGIERHVQWLAEALRRRGHEANVLTLDRAFEDGRSLPPRDQLGDIEVTRIPFVGSTRYPVAPTVLAHLRGYDVVHVHAVDFLADWLVATRPVHRKPIVLSTHGGFFHTNFAPRAKRAWFHTATRAMLAGVDALIYTSDQDRELFSALTSKGVTLRNAVDLAPWGALSRAPSDGEWVTLGRVDVHKGLSRLLRALAVVRDRDPRPFRARVIGPSVVPGLTESLLAERDELGLGERVSFEGKVDIEVMHEAVRVAQLGLWPAEYESFGISVVETMGAGLLPVLQDNRAFRYFVQGRSGVLTDYADPARAAGDILRARDLDLAEWSAAARAKAQDYDWDAVIGGIEDVYRSVTGR